MPLRNVSLKITEFVIGGFDKIEKPMTLGIIILFVYIIVMLANIVNILFIICDRQLHKPMYLLICNLAAVDMLYSTSSSPTMIRVLLSDSNIISYLPCIIQMIVFHVGAVMEMFSIAVMALDRLIAVSSPLRYSTFVTKERTIIVTFALWVAAFGCVSVMPATVIPLPMCHLTLRYTYCDYPSLIRASCVNPTWYFNMISSVASALLFGTFSLICVSYFFIILAVISHSKSDKKKTFSTCLSHFIVVICYYCPLFVTVVLTRLGVVLTLEERQGLTIGTILGPSLVNPFVYCFRTERIKNKLTRMFKKLEPIE